MAVQFRQPALTNVSAKKRVPGVLENVRLNKDSDTSALSKQGDSIGMATITSNSVNVRNGAGSNYERIGGLTMGKNVAVYEEKSGWLKIRYGSDYGWVSKACTDYKKMTGPNYMTIDASKLSLKDLNHWAIAEGVDARDLEQSSKFVAEHCVDTSSHGQCTRGTALFMQLTSYARYEADGGQKVNEYYKSACRADLFGDGSSNGNIRTDVSKEYTETHVDLIKTQSEANSEITKHLKKNGDYVSFHYTKADNTESWHIVFFVDGKYYSDFKQGTPTGLKSGAKNFKNVNYYNH